MRDPIVLYAVGSELVTVCTCKHIFGIQYSIHLTYYKIRGEELERFRKAAYKPGAYVDAVTAATGKKSTIELAPLMKICQAEQYHGLPLPITAVTGNKSLRDFPVWFA